MTNEKLCVALEVQNPNKIEAIPTELEMKNWGEAALQKQSQKKAFKDSLSVLIRIVNRDESAQLNEIYREKNGPTNVLSFPNEVPDFMLDIEDLNEQNSHLGDLVICAPIVFEEATQQAKSTLSHWAHLIIHGVLHLQGYDHLEDQEALVMEALEIQILQELGFSNPYKQI